MRRGGTKANMKFQKHGTFFNIATGNFAFRGTQVSINFKFSGIGKYCRENLEEISYR